MGATMKKPQILSRTDSSNGVVSELRSGLELVRDGAEGAASQVAATTKGRSKWVLAGLMGFVVAAIAGGAWLRRTWQN